MLDIGDDQFLVLLFVVEPKDDDIGKLGQAVIRDLAYQAEAGGVDVVAVALDFVPARPGKHAALRSRMPVAQLVVVGVEQVAVAFVEGRVAWRVA